MRTVDRAEEAQLKVVVAQYDQGHVMGTIIDYRLSMLLPSGIPTIAQAEGRGQSVYVLCLKV
jgi:hypothetical protein